MPSEQVEHQLVDMLQEPFEEGSVIAWAPRTSSGTIRLGRITSIKIFANHQPHNIWIHGRLGVQSIMAIPYWVGARRPYQEYKTTITVGHYIFYNPGSSEPNIYGRPTYTEGMTIQVPRVLCITNADKLHEIDSIMNPR